MCEEAGGAATCVSSRTSRMLGVMAMIPQVAVLKISHAMRSVVLYGALLALLGMAGCKEEGGYSGDDYTVENPQAGDYLAAMFAGSHKEWDVSSALLRSALAQSSGDAALLLAEKLFLQEVMQGHIAQALQLAEEYPALMDANQLTGLTQLVDALGRGDGVAAGAAYDALMSGEQAAQTNTLFETMVLPVLGAWAHVSAGEVDAARGIIQLNAHPAFVDILRYQQALLTAVTKPDLARVHFDVLVSQPVPSRMLLTAAEFYRTGGEAGIADDLMQDFMRDWPQAQGTDFYERKRIVIGAPLIEAQRFALGEILLEAAAIYRKAERLDEAMVMVQLALHLDAKSTHAQLMLAGLLSPESHAEEILALYQAIPVDSLFHWSTQQRIARHYYDIGQADKALTMLSRLGSERQDAYDAVLAHADLLMQEERYTEAVERYSDGLARMQEVTDKKSWAVYYARGICYEQLDAWPKAQADFERALVLKPNQPDVMNYLGYSWLMRGEKLTEALDLLKKAATARPRDAHILDSYGWALALSGDFDQARIYLERAVSLLPADAVINDHLGDIYWHLGRRKEAKFQWQRALGGEPDEVLEGALMQKLAHGLMDKEEAVQKPQQILGSSSGGDAQPAAMAGGAGKGNI